MKVEPLELESEFTALFDEEEYCAMVEKGKEHIREGDIFQVVLSNRLCAKARGSLFDTYRVLRAVNPSPYMFYLAGDDMEITGSSPETLVRLERNKLFTYPLAGTRPRGKTEAEDEAFEEDLINNEKELAEHNMLVDLGRNDLGRVSTFGSVRVETYLRILKFSHVMHIGSTVSGEINPHKTAIDAIGSVFPAGTLSGAPKIRACEIIDELEPQRRNAWCGSVGYLSYCGNMDTSITIRTLTATNGQIYCSAGGGIVADSQEDAEYQETFDKVNRILHQLEN